MTKNILMVGVGGQGTILACKLLTIGLMSLGYDVKMSEIHGMSQRGGDVSSAIRYGKKVYSPVIEIGEADYIVAFEKLEGLRALNNLKKDGTIILNDYEIPPMSVISNNLKYPNDILDYVKKYKHIVLDAQSLASEVGNDKVLNVILLGVLIKELKLEEIDWDKIIKENVKPNFVSLNQKALRVGMEYKNE